MNYQAFTNASLLMMHHAARGALAVDDELNKLGQQARFRVRETPDWVKHAAELEAEMLGRGLNFDGIIWAEHQHSASDVASVPRQEVCCPPDEPVSSDKMSSGKSGSVAGEASPQNDEVTGPQSAGAAAAPPLQSS